MARRFVGVRLFTAAAVTISIVGLLVPQTPVEAATSVKVVRPMQRTLAGLGFPVGAADGIQGPQTRRALCAFRQVTAMQVTRDLADTVVIEKIKTFDGKTIEQLPKAPSVKDVNGKTQTTYLLAHEHCQVMFYVENGRYVKIMPISTATNKSICGEKRNKPCTTPNGTYLLGGTQPGWQCSSLYPEGCGTYSMGELTAPNGEKGNMYNFRSFGGGYGVHGSTKVPPEPASHGCIRVTIADSDWMYKHVGNNGPVTLKVVDTYYR